MLRAIRSGEVDALLVESPTGPQVFTLQGLDAESNRFRGEILAQVSDAVIAIDDERRVTYLNAAAARQYGVTASEVLGHRLSEVYEVRWLDPSDEAAAAASLRENDQWRGEKLHIKRNGEVICVESSVTRLHSGRGARPGLLAVIRDITERKEAEAALAQNAALFAKVVDQAPGGVYVVDAQFRMHQVNAKALPVFASAQPLIGRDFDEVLEIVWGPEFGSEIGGIFRHTLSTGEQYVSPGFSHVRHDIGVEQAYEWETQRVTLPDGQYGVICYFTDVTERHKAEAALTASLREKEVLLSEVHHRVKNNLQIVSSLLNLQVRRITDPAMIAAFASTRDRVWAMAAVHQQLYERGNFAQIHLALHLEKLTRMLMQAHAVTIEPVLELEPVTVNLKVAVPLSLIANELIVNSLKYAFTGRRKGTLTVGLRTNEASSGLGADSPPQHELRISDDGPGLPPAFDLAHTSTLGLRLVRDLSRQIRGEVEIESPPVGTSIVVRWPMIG